MMRCVKCLLGVGVSLSLAAPPVTAQIPFISDVFGRITDFNIYAVVGAVRGSGFDPDSSSLLGFGAEVSFDVGVIRLRAKKDSVEVRTLKEVTITRGATADSTMKFEISYKDTTVGLVLDVDVTLGYSLISGYRRATNTEEVSASIQELPIFALYAVPSRLPDGLLFGGRIGDVPVRLGTYAGVRTGIVTLRDVSGRIAAMDPTGDLFLEAGGTTFQLGLSTGFVLKTGRALGFGELQWTHREFRGVDWEVRGSDTVPATLPEELDVGGFTFAFGIQIPLPGKR